jgi:NADPH:quinone reductase-like Zn-dependent oxidoreductase
VCSGRNASLVTSLGADDIIDYTREDFTRSAKTYDLILDAVGATSFARCTPSLTAEGIFLPCIMSLADLLFRMPWTSMTRGRRLKGGVAIENRERMDLITELAAAGTLKPVVDRSYPLDQIAEAFTYVERGHKKGNVVIIVDHP